MKVPWYSRKRPFLLPNPILLLGGTMKKHVRAPLLGVFLLSLVLSQGKTAYGFNGYVDPGSGLLALQTIGSILAAGLYYFRGKIASLFRRDNADRKEEVPAEVSPVAPESHE
jgi:hypothetical protein